MNMRLDYCTSVTFRSDDAPEAETKNLVGDMVRLNTPVPECGDRSNLDAVDKVGAFFFLCLPLFHAVYFRLFIIRLLEL